MSFGSFKNDVTNKLFAYKSHTHTHMVESAWAEDMGQFLYNLDPDTRKITRRLEKMK